MFVWMSGFQKSLAHTDFNMFVDEWTSANESPAVCFDLFEWQASWPGKWMAHLYFGTRHGWLPMVTGVAMLYPQPTPLIRNSGYIPFKIGLDVSMWLNVYRYWMVIFLAPANEVWEGYVFTRVCQSTGDGGIPACIAGLQARTQGGSWGVWPGGYPSSMHWGRPLSRQLLLRVVRILLECILVITYFHRNSMVPMDTLCTSSWGTLRFTPRISTTTMISIVSMAATPLTRLLFKRQWDSNPAPTVIGALLTCNVLWYFLQNIIGGSCRVTLVCFWLFTPKFWEVTGTYEKYLVNLWMQFEWRRHSKVVGNFLHS